MTHISPSPALLYQRFAEVRIAFAARKGAQVPAESCLQTKWLHRACPLAQAPAMDVPSLPRSYSPPGSGEDFTQSDSFRMFSFKVGRPRRLAHVSYRRIALARLFLFAQLCWEPHSCSPGRGARHRLWPRFRKICSTGRPWGRRQPGLASQARYIQSCVLTEFSPQWGSADHLAAAGVPALCAKLR